MPERTSDSSSMSMSFDYADDFVTISFDVSSGSSSGQVRTETLRPGGGIREAVDRSASSRSDSDFSFTFHPPGGPSHGSGTQTSVDRNLEGNFGFGAGGTDIDGLNDATTTTTLWSRTNPDGTTDSGDSTSTTTHTGSGGDVHQQTTSDGSGSGGGGGDLDPSAVLPYLLGLVDAGLPGVAPAGTLATLAQYLLSLYGNDWNQVPQELKDLLSGTTDADGGQYGGAPSQGSYAAGWMEQFYRNLLAGSVAQGTTSPLREGVGSGDGAANHEPGDHTGPRVGFPLASAERDGRVVCRPVSNGTGFGLPWKERIRDRPRDAVLQRT